MANTIKVSVLGDVKDINRKLGNVDKQLSGFGKKISGVGKALVGAFAAVGIVSGIKSVVSSASDLNETVSKTQTIFGKSSPAIMKWADGAAKSLGMSKQAALEGVSTFGNFFNQIGIGTAESEKMSKSLVQMSTDLASFNNADPAQVMDALSSATRGEYDALQKYIPTINAAKVEQEALRQTHKKSVKDLTDAEKATALYTLAQKGQGKAAGDFARTQGGLANQQKILNAQMADAKAKIGQALLPLFTKLATFINTTVIPAVTDFANNFKENIWPAIQETASNIGDKLIPVLQDMGNFLKDTVVPALMDMATWIQDNVTWIGPLVAGIVGFVAAIKVAMIINGFITAMKAFSLATKLAKIQQWLLNTALLANPIVLIVALIVGLVAAIIYLWKTNEGFRNTVIKVWNALKSGVGAVVNWFRTAIPDAWNWVKSKTQSVWNAIKSFFSSLWNGIKSLVSGAVNSVKSTVSNGWNSVKSASTSAWNAVKSGISNIWNGIKSAVRTAIDSVVSTVRGIRGKVTGIFSGAGGWLLSAGRDILRGLISGIDDMIGVVKSKLQKVTSLIPDWKGPADKDKYLLRNAGRLIMDGLINGIDDKTNALKRQLRDVTRIVSGTDVGMVGGGGLALSMAGGANGAPTYITFEVNVPPTADKASIGREIQGALDEWKRVNGR